MPLAPVRLRSLWAALTALLVVLSSMTLLPAAPAQAAPVSISCEPGTVYSVSAGGQLWKIANGQTSKAGSQAKGVSNFNGLGVGDEGTPVYAIERNYKGPWYASHEAGVTVYRFNKVTGTWSSTGSSIEVTGIGFIAGAVDFSTGNYYFGGYSDDGKTFELYIYNASTSTISKEATVDTSNQASSDSNGDMAFDGQGRLYIVRGVGDKTTVFTVSKAALKGNGNKTLQPSVSGPFGTSNRVNGVAFDADGAAYLGSSDNVKVYDLPDWSGQRTFSSSSGNGTDLSSCSTPATVKLIKNIKGDRANADDQFKLSFKQGDTVLGSSATVGKSSGIQDEDEEVVQLQTRRGVVLTFSEYGIGQTDLSDYSAEYSCTVDDKPLKDGVGTSGTVKIPSATVGDETVCTITNSPLTANVAVHKDVVDENGENKKSGKDWTVGAKATATANSVTSAPTAITQKTNADGDAKWALKFDKPTGRATIAVFETQQDGFEFKSASCNITHLDGSKDTKELTSETSTDLTGIKPGDDVKCSYLNKVKDTSLTLVKKVDNKAAGGTAKDTDWSLKAVGDKDSGNNTIDGKTGSTDVTKAKVKAGKYALSESVGPKGYTASGWSCRPTTGSGSVTSDKSSITLKAGDDVTCTITNTAKTGTVTWKKTDEGGNALKGSTWTLKGPGGSEVLIEDCSAASAKDCSGPDKDPAEGRFSVGNLKWGDHTLVEKSAPAGYLLDDAEHTFTVSGDKLDKKFAEPFENVQKPPVALPLTGGSGSQIFIIGGASLLTAAGVVALLKGLRRRNRKH